MVYVSSSWIEFGTIYTVEANELYLAIKGNGAKRAGAVVCDGDGQYQCGNWLVKLAVQLAILTWSRPRLRLGSMCAVCCRGVLVLAFVEDGYSELHMDAWDFLAGLLIFEEAGDIVSGPPCSRTLRLAD